MMSINPQFENIGKQFVQVYYQTFQTNRAGLGDLYTEHSMLTYEGEQFKGTLPIVEKLSKLPHNVKHHIVTCDVQPTPNNGIIVCVCGDLAIEDNQPIKFCQLFNLVPNGSGSYAVFNDIFRLCIG